MGLTHHNQTNIYLRNQLITLQKSSTQKFTLLAVILLYIFNAHMFGRLFSRSHSLDSNADHHNADLRSNNPTTTDNTTTTTLNDTIHISIGSNFPDSTKCDQDNANNHNSSITDTLSTRKSCMTASFSTLILVTLVLISAILGRQYVIDILIYIDSLDTLRSTVVFAIMFTVVAFPIMWGYVLLNVACGYTYGFIYGSLVTSGCAAYAILCAQFIIRRFFRAHVERHYITNTQARALMEVVSGPSGYKIVFLTRLTPLPFGVQNAIFAVSGIKTLPYILSSVCGLISTQLVFAYMGSTFRSMTQVLSEEQSYTTWIILAVQILVTVGLTVFIIKLAKRELEKKMPAACSPIISSSKTESRGSQTSSMSHHTTGVDTPTNTWTRTHSRNMSVNIPPIVPGSALQHGGMDLV